MKVRRTRGTVTVVLETKDELHGLNGLVEYARQQDLGACFPNSYVSRVADRLAASLPLVGARGLDE